MLFKTGLLARVQRATRVIILSSGLAALIPFPAIAASNVTLAWNSSTGTNIAGYKIYYGAASGTYTNTVDVGNVTNATISSLISGTTYYFAATAYDTFALESDYSTEAIFTNVAAASPVIVLSSPVSGASYAAPAAVNLAATVTANGHTINKVQFYNGATLLAEAASAPYTLAWTSVGAGSYSLTAQAVYDSGSTVASTPANVTVTAVPLPSIALTAPANGASYAAPATINLAATVTANGHTITKVQFYNGATLLAEDTSAPYTLAWTSVSAGSYSLTAQAVYDSGSAVASTSANVTVTNVTLPSIALTAPANGASYAAPATVNLAANVTANGHTITKVQFYNGNTLLAEDTSAPYTLAWTSVSAGNYSLRAQVVYDSGGTVASAPAYVTVTNVTPPSIALTAPANGSSYTAPATLNLAATVSANGHTITKVQFYNGATLLAEDTTAPYSFAWTNVSAGNYSLTAQVVYDSGSTVASAAANVVLTNPLPSIVVAAPVNGSSYAAPATINLIASVTANGHSITKVQFYNGATLLAEDTSAPYTFAWASVGIGSYSLTARAVYDSGSTVASAPANVTVTSATPPSIALTAPANGASYAAHATINLAAGVTANGHTITKVQFYNGAALLSESASAPYNFAWANVSAGSYSLTAQAVYDSGSAVASAAANVTVTNVPLPSIALTAPANGASYAAPATIGLAATVTANGHAITKVQFYNGATLLAEDSAAPYTFTWTSVSAGNYSLTAQAIYDSGSAVASAPANVTVAASRPGNTPPMISAIADQSMTTNSTQRLVRFTVSDPGTPADLLTVTATSDNLTLVPNGGTNIVLTSDAGGTNQTLAITPVSGRTGEANITIIVGNGSVTTNATFRLSVTGEIAWTLWWESTGGYLAAWSMNGTNSVGASLLHPAYVGSGWKIVGAGDLSGRGKTDLLFHSTEGYLAAWFMDGTNASGSSLLNPALVDPSWRVAGIVALKAAGKTNILWQHSSGVLAYWQMNGTNAISTGLLNPSRVDPSWSLVGAGDFNGQGDPVLLWQHSSGVLAYWKMDSLNGINAVSSGLLNPSRVDPSWKLVGTPDVNGDGKSDLLWQHSSGVLAYWQMNGTNAVSSGLLNPSKADPSWKVVGAK
jgi:sulfur relay (sulfurtransferase) complex TusBCD TusD component (DsrE family)